MVDNPSFTQTLPKISDPDAHRGDLMRIPTLALLAALLLPLSIMADTVYTYTGSDFVYVTVDRVLGSMEICF
jgi:hypothetical protein